MDTAKERAPQQCDAPNGTGAQCCVPAVPNELLLCGSGVLAYTHIGVLQALEERGVRIGMVSGTSTGALIAALYSNGVSSSGIQNLFLNRQPERFKPAPWLGSTDGCTTNARMFCPVVDLVPAARKFVRDNGLKPNDGLRIICYDLLTQKPVVFEGRQYDLALALAASCAVPGIARPVRTGKHLLVDIATREWQPESYCGRGAIVSRPVYDGDEVAMLSPLDKWLRQRQHSLHVVDAAPACAQQFVIETKLAADSAHEAVIAAGYGTAKSALGL